MTTNAEWNPQSPGWSTVAHTKRGSLSEDGANPQPTVVRFTREFLVSLFEPECSPLADMDTSLFIFADTALEPMANVPLSDTEKKILANGTVNSEIGSRRNYSARSTTDDKGNGRDHARGIVSSRGGRGGSVRRGSDRNLSRRYDGESPERSMSELDPQGDTNILSDDKGILRSFLQKQSSGVDILGTGSFSSSPMRQPSSMAFDSQLPDLFGNMSVGPPPQPPQSLVDPFLNSAFSASTGSLLGGLQQTSEPLSSGLQFGSNPRAPIPAPLEYVPSSWLYKDPQGNVHGPFATELMQDWYSKTFFSEDLPIKREKDILFEPLSNLLLRFGRDRPFTRSDEYEMNAHLLLQQQQQQQQQQQLRFSGGTPGGFLQQQQQDLGYSPFGGVAGVVGAPQRFNSTPVDFMSPGRGLRFGDLDSSVGVSSHGWGQQIDTSSVAAFGQLRSGSMISTFGQTPDLTSQFGHLVQPQQQISQQQPQYGAFSQFTGGAIPQFGTVGLGGAISTSPVKEDSHRLTAWHTPQQTLEILAQPQQDTNTNTNAHYQEQQLPEQEIYQSERREEVNQQEQQPQESDREVSPVMRIPTPEPTVKSPVAIPQEPQAAPPANKVKGKKSQNLKKVVTPQPESSVVPSPVSSVTTPVSATGPVWSTDKATPKLSLKQIQELEQKEFEQKEREKVRKAHLKLMAEAQALAEQSANGAVIAAGGTAWTASTGVKKPTLADIMKEEERRRKVDEVSTAVASGGVKTYAGHIVPVATNASPAFSRPGASVAVAPVTVAATAVPKATSAGWNVVGKPASKVPAPVVVAPVPVAPRVVPVAASRPTASAVSPSSRSVTGGPTVGFLQWMRQALKPLERSTTAGVKVDDFIQILLTIPMNEPKTVAMICDDTLGGLTALDPHKFAEEYMRRRRADAVNDPAAYATTPAASDTLKGFESPNGFVVVQKKKGGKK
ncbi:hypothetical protein BC830DRAFT_1123725 [Chytriomyces sp. MP71]|nr:hypothetical protein BC830DRAFT_1123725 [Chytriomyces sp. MP71]